MNRWTIRDFRWRGGYKPTVDCWIVSVWNQKKSRELLGLAVPIDHSYGLSLDEYLDPEGGFLFVLSFRAVRNHTIEAFRNTVKKWRFVSETSQAFLSDPVRKKIRDLSTSISNVQIPALKYTDIIRSTFHALAPVVPFKNPRF